MRNSAPPARRVLELCFLLCGSARRAWPLVPGLRVALPLPLCQIPLAFFNMSGGIFWYFFAWADTTSFHGHKHFPASLPFWGFAASGPAESCCL